MSVIKAFVGHSFTDDDKTLNRTFLDYFDLIKSMDIGFTWEHAEAAQPRELAEKVKNLIRDKNLFIGICTRKERVIGPDTLERCWIKRKSLRSHERNFLWKTSDWIIQEIGLAVGREMDIILLKEEGLRSPGELQGSIEYIEFNRQYPERSFGKILEMIRAIIPKSDRTAIQELNTSIPENAPQEQRKNENDNWWLDPKPEWSFEFFRMALWISINKDDSETEGKIADVFPKSPEGCCPSGLARLNAYRYYSRLFLGKESSLDKMERLAKENPEVEDVQLYLGKAYEIYKEYEKSGKVFKITSEITHDKRLYYLGEAAKAYLRGGMKPESEEIIAQMKQEVINSDVGEGTLVTKLREIAEIESEIDIYYGLSESLLDLKPDDTDTRFNLAYKYSQGNEQKLSLFHYLRIPENMRGGGAWNNLAVQYDRLQIVGSSIKSYRKAEKAENTLAMSNIARTFYQAGFLQEAEDICMKAQNIKNFDKNIYNDLARIKEIPGEEMKKEEEIVKEVSYYSDFYKAYGRAFCKTNPSDCIGQWEGPKCSLNLEIKGNSFIAEGTYESSYRSGLLALGTSAIPLQTKKHIVKYIGTISGLSVKCVMTEEDCEEKVVTTTNLYSSGLADRTERKVLMVISDSFNEIQVYDKNSQESQKLYTLKKIYAGE
ncbi:MAG: hypothetical protein WCU00_03085 [Candidatus Latescibacterota bacterium]